MCDGPKKLLLEKRRVRYAIGRPADTDGAKKLRRDRYAAVCDGPKKLLLEKRLVRYAADAAGHRLYNAKLDLAL